MLAVNRMTRDRRSCMIAPLREGAIASSKYFFVQGSDGPLAQPPMRHGPDILCDHDQIERCRDPAHVRGSQYSMLPARRVTLRARCVIGLFQHERTAAGDLVVLLELGRQI